MFINTGNAHSQYPVNRGLDDAVARSKASVTVLWGVAGFVRRVLMRAQELNADFKSVRMVMTTGEAASTAMRDDFRRRMRDLSCADTIIVNRYGSTEQGGTMIECQDGGGFHSLAPDQLFHEVVNLKPASDWRTAKQECSRYPFDEARHLVPALPRWRRRTLSHDACPHCGRTSLKSFRNLSAQGTSSRSRERW